MNLTSVMIFVSNFRRIFKETTKCAVVEIGTCENEGSLCLFMFYSDLFLNILNVKNNFTFQNREYLITSILFVLYL